MSVAWITGGGTGIGRALAERLYRGGAKVVISGRRRDILESAAREIAHLTGSGEILAIVGDASDPFLVNRLVGEVKSHWGAIDLLINNAGVNSTHPFPETPVDEYRQAFDNNCLSAIRATQAVLPDMLAAHSGAIINISSIYGRWGSGRSASYSVSKFALTGYTDVLRQGLVGSGVHVMGVFPGFIKTQMTLPFVRPGSLRSYMGKTPDQMARAILAALRRKKDELYYPWYVPLVLRLHHGFPRTMEFLRKYVER